MSNRPGPTAETLSDCDTYRRGIANGESPSSIVGYLADLRGVQRPAIWKRLRAGGAIAPYQPRTENGKGRPIGGGAPGYTERRRQKASEVKEQVEKNLPPVIERDPCFLCGVRADVGCKHRVAA